MIILSEIKVLQRILGLSSLDVIENAIVRSIYFIVISLWGFMITTFFVLTIRIDVYQAFSVLPPIISMPLILAYYSHLLINCKRLDLLLAKFQSLINERSAKAENKSIYTKAEQQNSLATKIIIYLLLSTVLFTLSPFALVACHWCMGTYTIDSWIFYLPVWTPFEFNTTVGCALMVLYETFAFTCGILIVCFMPTLMIAFVIFLQAFIVDTKSLFGQLSLLSKSKDSKITVREMDMIYLCKEIIILHQEVNRLLRGLADEVNAFILQTIVVQATIISISLLIIEKYPGSIIAYDLLCPILAVFFLLILLAKFFYMGQCFHSNVMELNHAIYQSEWYRFPCSVRRFVLLMMMRSQQPFYLSAYGMMELNLENFVHLLKRIYSAFMILRNME